jgi:tetratricopeptide (TPR) repeat protein
MLNLERRTFALLFLLVGVAYGNSLSNGFVYDDSYLVVKNGLITKLETLPKLVSSDYWIIRRDPYGELPAPPSGLYRPLVLLTYAMNYALSGLNPVGFHLFNVVVHFLVTWVVYLIAIQVNLQKEAALVGAALFAVHPLHTEAVTNVVGRAELLMALGVLGSLWLAGTGRYWWSLGTFGLSLFCKEQAVMFPAVLLLYDLCFGGTVPFSSSEKGTVPQNPHRMLLYGGCLVVLSTYFFIRWAALGRIELPPTPMIDNPLAMLEGLSRVLTAFKVGGLYLWLCVWPGRLSADYSYDAIPAATSLLEPLVLSGLLGWSALIAGSIWAYLQRDRRVAFACGFTVLMYVPISNLLVLIGTIMGERLFYLPSAGLCLLAAVAYERLTAASPLFASRLTPHASRVLVVLICLALTVRTIVRNFDWYSNETAFSSAFAVFPQSAKIQHMMGLVAADRQEWAEANEYFDTALEIYPTYSVTDAEFNAKLGGVLLNLNGLERATEVLEKAVALAADDPTAQYNLGLAYVRAGRYAEAERAYRRAVVLAPKNHHIYNGLSYALLKQSRYLEAERMAAEAVQLYPDFLEAHYNRGRALEGLGAVAQAMAAYERVLQLDPGQRRLRTRLARLQAEENGSTHGKVFP